MLSIAFNVLLNWNFHHISRRVTKSKFLTSPIHLLNRLRLVGAVEAVFFQVHVEYSPNLSTRSSQIFEILYVLVMCLYGSKQLLLLRICRICVWDDTVAIGTSTDQVLDPLHVSQSETHPLDPPLDHDAPRWTEAAPQRGWPATSSTGPKDFLWELQVLQSWIPSGKQPHNGKR